MTGSQLLEKIGRFVSHLVDRPHSGVNPDLVAFHDKEDLLGI